MATVNDDLEYCTNTSSNGDDDEDSSTVSKHPTSYKCWFTVEYWEKIEAVLKLHSFKIRPIVTYLKRKYQMPNEELVFCGMNESTVRGWFESDGCTLRPCPQAIVEALKKGKPTTNLLHLGQKSIWDGHKDVETDFIEWIHAKLA